MKSDRLFYIDNLRIFLISLVVLHHLAITYGAPGSWYYNESAVGLPEILPMSMFVASNQSFFMGFFFFISAFFIMPSLNQKGVKQFVADRATRLGLPLFFFSFLLSPLTVFIHHRIVENKPEPFWQYLQHGWGVNVGPLWFVEALILFSALFLLFHRRLAAIKMQFPGTAKILLFALFTGLLQFVIRIWLPVGWSMPYTGFQFPFFVQYIFLFVLGVVAYQNNWADAFTLQLGRRWFLFAQVMIFIGFPLLFLKGGDEQAGVAPFMGGFTPQSIGYSLWEQVTGISLMLGLAGLFKHLFNHQSTFAHRLSESAFGVFVFHTPVIVALSAVLSGWHINPLLKFVALSGPALVLCFGVAWLIKQLPGLKKIF